MAYANDARATGFNFFGSVSNLSATLADRFAKFKLYRATMVELEKLSDRELNDLGIARAMIKGVAIEAAYGAN
ncbi:DUF1127 domain-containing protein [Marivivens aquimaris]|uniref:DUF1127 domain-containing protein n=1 Tax=Marivivens aquimaris TaxID=2774876 RepID=UPI00187FF357|nr:DUF1127 domain-containing protein [Marivivens aquimaris]